MIRDLFHNGTNIVYVMCVMNTDAKSYLDKDSREVSLGGRKGDKRIFVLRPVPRNDVIFCPSLPPLKG